MGIASSEAGAVSRSRLAKLIWYERGRWGKFGSLFLLILTISFLASFITRWAILEPERTPSHHIAVLAPLSGTIAADSDSLIKGAQLAVAQLNDAGGVGGSYLAVKIFDTAGGTSDALAAIGADDKISAAILGVTDEQFSPVTEALSAAGILSVVPTRLVQTQGLVGQSQLLSLGYSRTQEARFLANYVRNVLGEVLVSTITDEAYFNDETTQFQKAFERFGAPISRQWRFDSSQSDVDFKLAQIVEQVREDNTAGTLYLALKSDVGAKLVSMLRQAGLVNQIVGPRDFSSHGFSNAIAAEGRDRILNGVHTTAPVMADTAGDDVQVIRSAYVRSFGEEADWIALMSAKSVSEIARAISSVSQEEGAQLVGSELPYPIWVGRYDGSSLVSALTQLQPIGEGEVDNYIKSVREGRALYVNDRFMYKTNMVYTGLMVREVRNFDQDAGTFEMDFALWFRYRGTAEPQDVIFANAAEPIELGEPVHREAQGDLRYIGYELSGKFNSNFQDVGRSYGQDLLGTSFRHRLLDKNNLRYVVDLVGMGLLGGQTLESKVASTNAISSSMERVLESAWVSQDIQTSESLGTLTFVGNGKPAPDFSKIMFSMILTDDKPSLTDFVPRDYLVYILLFGITGSIAATLMDRNRVGRRFFWNAQSWLLRAICWPLAIISAGTLVLDSALSGLDFGYIDILVAVYRIALWLAGTAIVVMAVNRFIWSPLEGRTKRRVPGSIRAIVAIVIYLLAIVGVLSYVFGMNVTSILAASGVLSLVLGLALQSNIANIFSGIVLNLERPFEVGDILRLSDGTEAEVMDITWRSIRVKDIMGVRYSIPNALATNQQMTRICRAHGDAVYQNASVSVAPKHDPDLVLRLLVQALNEVPEVAKTPAPAIRYNGANQTEFANYAVRFASPEYYDAPNVTTKVWQSIWRVLGEQGIEVSTLDSPSLHAAIKRRSA